MEEQIDDGITISDEGEGIGQGIGSIKEIVLRQIRKIGDICTQELTGGYWENKPLKTAGGMVFTKVYHPDLREGYCNALEFLIDLVYPETTKEFKEKVDAHYKIEFASDEEGIRKKLKNCKLLFRELNKEFKLIDYFTNNDGMDE